MEGSIFLIFCFAIIVPLIFGIAIPVYKKHAEATGGIVNYDASMRKFVYQINLQYDDVVKLLSVQSDIDDLTCAFDFNRSVIKFSEYGSYREYYFQMQEYEGFSILRLEQVAMIGMKSQVPFKLNPFIVGRLQAKIISFSQYGF